MSVLRNLESKLAGLVEGTFSRAFKSEVRPVEIARKLAREMEEHRVASLSRTYAPNEYVVWLSPSDREQFEGYETELRRELSGYLLEHARRERIALLTRPSIAFETDDDLRLGEFGIQARLVRSAEEDDSEEPSQGDHGHTMVYSTSDRLSELRPSGASWTVRDLGSTNGVKVNGRKLDPSRPQSLRAGDTITLGTSDVIFELE